MNHLDTESGFEHSTIKRLKVLGYQHIFGMDIKCSQNEVVLKDVLRRYLPNNTMSTPLLRWAGPSTSSITCPERQK
jgi:hypothetical protein